MTNSKNSSNNSLKSNELYAIAETSGEHLFNMHCSGCHVQGGNIIRRNWAKGMLLLYVIGIILSILFFSLFGLAAFGLGSMESGGY